MSLSKLILVSGLPGSGKSFFAEKLAERIGARYLSSDRMRAAVHLRGKYAFSDKVSVYKKMFKVANHYLHKRESVVVDATFHVIGLRNMFLDFAKEGSVSTFCFEINAKEDLIKKRLSQPRMDSEADFAVYTMIKNEFEPWTTPRLKLESTNDNISSMLQEAMGYLEEENV